MSMFNRGLDDEFVDALNREYDKEDGWWRAFVDDKDVFLAIRENYVNAYYRGCSLLRLSWEAGTIVGEVHYKYLLRPSMCNEYVKVVGGKATLDDAKSWFLTDVSEVDSLKSAATPYAGPEKTGVHEILQANTNILDIEIAFGKDEFDTGAKRLDFAALQCAGDDVRVVFFEVKHFDNHKALRKRDARPEVIEQMETYRRKLHDNHDALIEGYRHMCCNLRSLRGVAKRHPDRHSMLESVVDGSRKLTIDENPVLLVFGFDGDQKDGKHWKCHRKKLKEQLKERVCFKGAAAGFKSRISA